ncbi:hypothetical protein ZWY2020_024004 [Hordeum vulgare]|nr:hypothetical protein ZWY2020_024004 [Hordeum vulgare]
MLHHHLLRRRLLLQRLGKRRDAEDWIQDMIKHYECNNVRPEDFVKFATFQLKGQAAVWWQRLKDSRGSRMISWDEFCRDFRAEAALLRVENSRKRSTESSSSPTTQVVQKQQKYWVSPPPPPRQTQQFKQSGGRGSSHPPNPAFRRFQRSKGILSAIRQPADVTCHKCGQKGYYANKCTSHLRLPPPPPGKPPSNAIVKFNPRSARFNMVNAAEVDNSSNVIMGNLSVNDFPVKDLFDSGASHCFMSKSFFIKHDFPSANLDRPLGVVSLGAQMRSNSVVHDVSLKMGDYAFLASPYVLGNSAIDLILGTDWLVMNKSSIDCQAKEVKRTHSSEDVIIL